MPTTEFERYFDLKTILSYLAPGKGGTIPAETPEEPVQTQTRTTPKNKPTIDLRNQPQGSYVGESVDRPILTNYRKIIKYGGWEEFCNDTGVSPYVVSEGADPETEVWLSREEAARYMPRNKKYESLSDFDPDEEGWLQKQFDQIEKELADITLPDPPTDKQKDDALKPVDSREQQVADSYVSEKCDKTKKKKLRKRKQIHKTEEKGKPPLTVDGYESPPPGDISEKERRILANAYASARKRGYNKERASKQAWGAVHNYRNKKK
jgi:hypothetical protein